MTLLADLLSTVFERRYRTASHSELSSRALTDLAEDLIQSEGESTGLAIAQEILSRFDDLEDADKLAFFEHIALAMDIDPDAVRETLETYEQTQSKTTYQAFVNAAEPRRQELIRRLNHVPGATGKLVSMRSELLRLSARYPTLGALDLDFSIFSAVGSIADFSCCAPSAGKALLTFLKRLSPMKPCIQLTVGMI